MSSKKIIYYTIYADKDITIDYLTNKIIDYRNKLKTVREVKDFDKHFDIRNKP